MLSLTVSHVSKRFKTGSVLKTALHDVSFHVPAGETVCLLGPNGSGKTTLLKTVSSLLSPDDGRVLLGDRDVHQLARQAKRLIGFASSEDHSFYGRLSVRMNLWFYAQLHGLSKTEWQERVSRLADWFDLGELDIPFRELSSGQKQRVLLTRALLHDPPLLLLDEPHQNLDPPFSLRLRDILIEELGKRRKKTIVVSTHHLEDAQKISDQWVVLSQGRVRFQGSLRQVRGSRPDHSLERLFQDLAGQIS